MLNRIDRLIESFVPRLKASGVEIQPEDNSARLVELEATLPKRLPQSFNSLLSRYSFPTFDLCGISMFAWPSSSYEYPAEASTTKGGLSEFLLPAGFVQIGRPYGGSFDAVCFDLNGYRQNREYSIVRIDHEEILCNSRIKVQEELWPSFRKMIERALSLPSTTAFEAILK